MKMRTIKINSRVPTPRGRLQFCCRPGAVLVEMAITSSLAFLFFFAALEFCRVAMIRHTVENALYEGARTGIVPGATTAEVSTKIPTGRLRGNRSYQWRRSARVPISPAMPPRFAPCRNDLQANPGPQIERGLQKVCQMRLLRGTTWPSFRSSLRWRNRGDICHGPLPCNAWRTVHRLTRHGLSGLQPDRLWGGQHTG